MKQQILLSIFINVLLLTNVSSNKTKFIQGLIGCPKVNYLDSALNLIVEDPKIKVGLKIGLEVFPASRGAGAAGFVGKRVKMELLKYGPKKVIEKSMKKIMNNVVKRGAMMGRKVALKQAKSMGKNFLKKIAINYGKNFPKKILREQLKGLNKGSIRKIMQKSNKMRRNARNSRIKKNIRNIKIKSTRSQRKNYSRNLRKTKNKKYINQEDGEYDDQSKPDYQRVDKFSDNIVKEFQNISGALMSITEKIPVARKKIQKFNKKIYKKNFKGDIKRRLDTAVGAMEFMEKEINVLKKKYKFLEELIGKKISKIYNKKNYRHYKIRNNNKDNKKITIKRGENSISILIKFLEMKRKNLLAAKRGWFRRLYTRISSSFTTYTNFISTGFRATSNSIRKILRSSGDTVQRAFKKVVSFAGEAFNTVKRGIIKASKIVRKSVEKSWELSKKAGKYFISKEGLCSVVNIAMVGTSLIF